jgi:hypothetical protein
MCGVALKPDFLRSKTVSKVFSLVEPPLESEGDKIQNLMLYSEPLNLLNNDKYLA